MPETKNNNFSKTKSKNSSSEASSDHDDDENVRQIRTKTKILVNDYNDSDYVEPPFDNTRILLVGVNESWTDETIKLYLYLLVNNNLDESFKIEEIRRNGNKLLVKFNRSIDFEQLQEKQEKLPIFGGEKIKLVKTKFPNTIKLLDLESACSEEILRLYFTNTKVSDGGDIERIRLFNAENKALIEFKNYNIVDRILSRTHVICENTIKIEKFYSQIEDENFLDDELDEIISSSKFSTNDRKKDKSENESSNSKLAKLKRSNFHEGYSLSSSMSTVQTNDKSKLIISNIQENINIQQLEFLINLITNKAEINFSIWSYEFKGKLMIQFKKEIDFKKVLYEYERSGYNNLNGKSIQIEPVTLTRTLIVIINKNQNSGELTRTTKTDNTTIDEAEVSRIPATRDLLELYFINKQRSGGGEIEYIERKSDRYWLVKMKDQRTIKELLSRKHVVDFKEIKVYPYYENFGLPYLVKPNAEDEQQSDQYHPTYKLKVRDERLRFFTKVKHLHQKLNEILSESNAVSKYNKNESNVLYVHYHSKLTPRIPYLEKIWRIKVRECIEYFLQIYKYEKLNLTYNQWTTILKTKQINENNLYKKDDDDDDYSIDGAKVIDAESDANRSKFFSNTIVITMKDTSSNIELNVVGPNLEVDKFIVKVKDIICEAYFTYELEERIINFKAYLLDCEQLMNKWLQEKEFASDDDDSDIEILLASNRNNLTDTSSIAASYSSRRAKNDETIGKLDKQKRKTIDDFITKLEKDHLDMDLSYGKLFQELGYTFLSKTKSKEDDEYLEFGDRTLMDESYLGETEANEIESQMDKIKNTLDELKIKITDMRRKFRQFLLNMKKSKKQQAKSKTTNSKSKKEEEEVTDSDGGLSDSEDVITLCVYVKSQMKIITLMVNRKCKIREFKNALLKQIDDDRIRSIDDEKLTYKNIELSNDVYSIMDYGITDKATIQLDYNSSK